MTQIRTTTATGSSGNSLKLKVVQLPKLKIGDYELYQVPLGIYDKDPEGVDDLKIIANNILKRFNSIIDFQNNQIYIKPNKLLYSPM